MTYAKKKLLYLFASGAIIVLSAGSASAQSKGPGEGVYRNTRPPDPEQAAKRKSVDDAYKTLMERIPDSKKSYDPWGNIRSKETTSSKQRNESK
jgi:hypothetical protein